MPMQRSGVEVLSAGSAKLRQSSAGSLVAVVLSGGGNASLVCSDYATATALPVSARRVVLRSSPSTSAVFTPAIPLSFSNGLVCSAAGTGWSGTLCWRSRT